MTMKKIILGSRGSDLALWQAHYVKKQLEDLQLNVDLKIIVTQGDRIQHLSFDKLEGKGFFTKEIEDALLNREIDLAVHSLKDLPTSSPEGLQIAALSYREDPRDVLLIRKGAYQALAQFGLAGNAVVGTSSARRKAQLLTFFPHITIKDLRGNVPTRVQKCRDGMYDAIVLAAAGIGRLQLDLSDFEVVYLDPKSFIPAPAQGVLGLQIRANEPELEAILKQIHRADVAETVAIEREILASFEGGCHMPLGVYCEKNGSSYTVYTAKSNEASALPVYLRLNGEQSGELVAETLNLANKQRKSSILITKNAVELTALARLLAAHGMDARFQSLIQTKAVPVTHWPSCDWVFFGSRNAVRHALQLHPPLLEHKKIGAVGPGTAKELQKLGFQPHFIGDVADVEQVAVTFMRAIQAGENVLLPLGEQSEKTLVRSWENKLALETVVVYTTSQHIVDQLPQTDYVLFTSPSNAKSWVAQGGKIDHTIAIAMGKTTADQLEQLGFRSPILSHGYNELALATTIFGLS